MENAKKMILIEPEVLEKLKSDTGNNVGTNNLSRLDEEMSKVLKTKLEDREKWTHYLQTLQRYLYFIGKDRKPLQIPILPFDQTDNVIKGTVKSEEVSDGTETSTRPNESSYSKSHLVEFLPKSYRPKGELLVDLLLKNKDKIYWNEKGTVFINNKEIYKSNIVDLLGDIVRPLKNSSPNGWAEFALMLKDLKVPTRCIGNPKRATFINVLSNSPTYDKKLQNPSKEKEAGNLESFSTPQTSPIDKDQVRKKISWKKWTPY